MNETEEASENNYDMIEIQLHQRNSDRIDRDNDRHKFDLDNDAHDQFKGEFNSSFSMSTRTLGNEEFNFSQNIKPALNHTGDESKEWQILNNALKVKPRNEPGSPLTESLDSNSEGKLSDVESQEVAEVLELAGDNLLPKGSEILLTMEFLNNALKFEVILDNLHNLLFAISFVEIMLLGVFFVFSMRQRKLIIFWAMHVPHFFHGFQGMYLLGMLPQSQQIVALVEPQNGEGQRRPANLAEYEAEVKTKVLEYALQQQQRFEKVLKVYTSITIVCFLCDYVDIVFQAIRSRGQGSHFSEMLVLAFCFIFQMINLAYPLWVIQVVWKFPMDMRRQIQEALFGFTNKLKTQIIVDLNDARTRMGRAGRQKVKQMAGFIKAKKTGSQKTPNEALGREIEMATPEI